ncbi:type IV pilus biogenesis protein PilM [Polynucleobacter sp. JS-Safj-400b-B2]|uniref:type IV pilus biogenesis protein PilM n=1 Tax=Polynucleobacter sp. JS-Safj-400b-B2 TaxID=2576921 RepID=UPI001C0BD7E9|nr:type IV pilus biogenesis protein PilM [Polynucleobacter sp. JS-Safj-400b-B2]MBU3625972.1 type IV pilus biogenesis protein PilM [Polynucleobacter sp. JS-Safj-400b-B2]
MASFGALILSFYLAFTLPQEASINTATSTDISATNFIAYRESLLRYKNANPGASGSIPDSSLTFDPGYIRNYLWFNTISGGVLYVYGNTSNDVLNNLYQKTLNSNLVGTNSSGVLINETGASTGVSLPAIIPSGAIVFVGS